MSDEPDPQRGCVKCGTPISAAMGFVLARDLARLWAGERIMPRELCGRCEVGFFFHYGMRPRSQSELVELIDALPAPRALPPL